MKNSINMIRNDEIINKSINFIVEKNFTSNSNYIMSIIDRRFLSIKTSDYIIKHISMSVKIRDINDVMMLSSEYIFIKFIIHGTLNKKLIIDKLRRQMHIINDLKVNMLIKFNIFDSEKIMLNYVIEQLTINSCKKIKIFMKITFKRNKINKIVRVYDVIIVSLHLNIMISIRLRDKSELFKNCDLMFILMKLSNCLDFNDDVLNYIIDVNMCVVQINNIFDKSIIIFKNSRLDIVQEYEKKDCYAIFNDYDHLIVEFDSRS